MIHTLQVHMVRKPSLSRADCKHEEMCLPEKSTVGPYNTRRVSIISEFVVSARTGKSNPETRLTCVISAREHAGNWPNRIGTAYGHGPFALKIVRSTRNPMEPRYTEDNVCDEKRELGQRGRP